MQRASNGGVGGNGMECCLLCYLGHCCFCANLTLESVAHLLLPECTFASLRCVWRVTLLVHCWCCYLQHSPLLHCVLVYCALFALFVVQRKDLGMQCVDCLHYFAQLCLPQVSQDFWILDCMQSLQCVIEKVIANHSLQNCHTQSITCAPISTMIAPEVQWVHLSVQ